MSPLIALTLGLFAAASGQAPIVKLGEPAPAFRVTNYVQPPPNTPMQLSGFKGSVVVLEFWATWCGPCIQAIPHINELQTKFAGRGVTFLSVSNEDIQKVTTFASKQPFKSLVGVVDQATWGRYVGNQGIPRTVIVGRDGKVLMVTHPSLLAAPHIEQALTGKIAPPEEAKAPTPGAGAIASFSISPSQGDGSSWNVDFAKGRYMRKGITVRTLVSELWRYPNMLVEVDDSFTLGRYDVTSLFPNLAENLVRRTLQDLTSSALKFAVLNEMREIEVLVLRCPKDLGPGFKKSDPNTPPSSSTSSKFFDGQNMPFGAVAGNVEIFTQLPVIDETKIEGNYDFRVTFETGSFQSLAEALARHGLILTKERRQMELLCVRPR